MAEMAENCTVQDFQKNILTGFRVDFTPGAAILKNP
jgi:hypothetical protein